jgi:two-component system, cell cycle response regulator CtrA
MNIVLIENDAALLKTLELLLRNSGNQVRGFNDPLAACAFLEHCGDLDVLIVDYMMPELTAPEVLERVRRHPCKAPRVILISGHTDIVATLDLEQMGIDAFLPKPLDLNLLLRLLYSLKSGERTLFA